MRAEDDLTGRAREYDNAQIAFGRVGWDDAQNHIDAGDENGPPGHRQTLVLVTLEGSQSVRGQKVKCALNSLSGRRVPKAGARVLVGVPFEMSDGAGVGVIIAAMEDDRRDNLLRGETTTWASEGAARTVVRNDGTVSLITTDDNTADGKVVVFSVSSTAWKFTAPWGSLVFDHTGFHVRTKAGPRLDMGGMAIPGLPTELAGQFSGYVTFTSPAIKLAAGSVFLGAGKVFNPAVWAVVDPAFPPPTPLLPGKSIQTQTVYVAP